MPEIITRYHDTHSIAAHQRGRSSDLQTESVREINKENTMNKRILKSVLAALVISSAPLAVSVVSAQSAPASKPATTSSKGHSHKGNSSKGNSGKGDAGKGNSSKGNSGKGNSGRANSDTGRGTGGSAVFEATAKVLGFSSDELRTQLKAGKTISELAKAKNISETVVHDAAVAALKTQLETKVAAGKLTQVQADERLKTAQADVTFGLQVGKDGKAGKAGQRR
jgi:hypothetical protein